MKKTKTYLAGVILLLCCAGCKSSFVEFSYFNLSQHEILVTDVVGVPQDATPGRLTPVPDEERLSENTSYFFKTIRVADKVKIFWKESEPKSSSSGKSVDKATTHE